MHSTWLVGRYTETQFLLSCCFQVISGTIKQILCKVSCFASDVNLGRGVGGVERSFYLKSQIRRSKYTVYLNNGCFTSFRINWRQKWNKICSSSCLSLWECKSMRIQVQKELSHQVQRTVTTETFSAPSEI